MKTMKVIVVAVMAVSLSIPAYAMFESVEAVGGKTLADFQKEFSGTKPVVAWNKYMEYKFLEKAPRPTLGLSHMRIEPGEGTITDYARGTKLAAGFVRYEEAQRNKGRAPGRYVAREAAESDVALGTKPVVWMLKRG